MILSMFFIYSLVFYLACALVVYKLKRRKLFWLKLILSSAIYFLFSFYYSSFSGYLKWGWFNASFILLYFMNVGIIMLCFKTVFPCALFYVAIGYTLEHFSSRLLGIVTSFVTLERTWRLILRFSIGVVTVVILFFLIIRKERVKLEKGSFLLPKPSTIIVSLISMLFICVLSLYSDSVNLGDSKLLVNLYGLGCSVLLIIIQFNLINHGEIREEMERATREMAAAHAQYMLSQENIKKINIKCHDLKHRIDLLRNCDCDDREEQLEELDKLLKNYESEFRTGNAALDTVLTLKSGLCNKQKIKITPIIDGNAVSVIKDDDIFSMFGNILDNAIDYLKTVDDGDLREIYLRVENKNNLLIIHSENYCGDQLKFKNGLPVTTKQDVDNHGFGMSSIKYIVNKYKGALSVKQEDENFILNIIIPA